MNEESLVNTKEIKKRGKTKLHPEGIKEYENASKYHQNYYHLTNKPTNCDICGKATTLRTLTQHQRGLRCQLINLQSSDIKPELNNDITFDICNKIYSGSKSKHEKTIRCQLAKIQLDKNL